MSEERGGGGRTVLPHFYLQPVGYSLEGRESKEAVIAAHPPLNPLPLLEEKGGFSPFPPI